MFNFLFHNPTKIIFGKKQISKISSEIPQDKKILIVGQPFIDYEAAFSLEKYVSLWLDYDFVYISSFAPVQEDGAFSKSLTSGFLSQFSSGQIAEEIKIDGYSAILVFNDIRDEFQLQYQQELEEGSFVEQKENLLSLYSVH